MKFKLNAELEVIERPCLPQDKQIYPACIEKMFASRGYSIEAIERCKSGNTQFCMQFEPGEEHIIERAYEEMKNGGKIFEPLG